MWHEYFFQKKKEALQLQLRDNFICTLSVLIIIIIMVKEMKNGKF